ncbi:MAG TPA: winged helix DNA-binding domain-containing protein [Bacteroidota bacterium]|nr:winged helix DNA-binding domain-containing protein [Bacteroidota bacterium]
MGAVQAQDYQAALWGVALRTADATEGTVERSIARGNIVRTWPMRGTLHVVAPTDVRWMLKYLNPRVEGRATSRHRQLGLDEKTFSRARTILARSLAGGKRLRRDDLYALLERHQVSCKGQRGIHILNRLAREGLICFGPREGKQHTFVLLDEWVPTVPMMSRDESLAELAFRYFRSHGPATVRDFAWWTGLALTEARAALEDIRRKLVSVLNAGETYWMTEDGPASRRTTSAAFFLPAFDEFLVGYTDRGASVDRRHARRLYPGGGILHPTIVIDGRIVGTWRRSVSEVGISVRTLPFASPGRAARRAIALAAQRLERHAEKPVKLLFG